MSESLYDECNNVDRGLNPDGSDPNDPPVNPSNSDLVGEAPDDLTHYMQRRSELAQQLEQAEPLAQFARFVATLDDPNAVELRRSITLNEIIELARAALTTPDSATGQEEG